MPIASLDEAIAGFRTPRPTVKQGIAMAAVGGLRGYTPWYANGIPGPSVATTVGINGEAVTPALGSTGGRFLRTNPVSPALAYMGRLALQASQPGMFWLIDRLWQNSGLSVTSTSAQAITPAALPARSADGTANGMDVLAALEWSATGGAGTPTVTLTYTDQDGNTGASGLVGGVASSPVGTFEIFTLAAGGRGIRAPTSFIQSSTRTSGAMHLVLFRILAQLEITTSNVGNALDPLTGGLPRIYDDSVLQLVWFPAATTATNFIGTYIETQG